jgi:glycolate oxidase iron-sulfur subunit
MDSPRGRIYLMKLAVEGKITLSGAFARHIDTCLGCMACVTACPSGVRYDQLIEATRPQIERHVARAWSDRLFRHLLVALFPHAGRLRFAALPLWLYQRGGLQAAVRASGALNLFPARLRAMEALLPPLSLSQMRQAPLPERVAPSGPRRRRVALLLGCVQRAFFGHVNAATARVLSAEGCEVVIPREQGCCGALLVHSGYEREALAFARRLIDSFDRLDVDTIVVNAAGCGSTLKEYGQLLRHDPVYATRAAALATKCKDVSEVLDELEPRAPRHPIPLRVAYHDACHLQHAQGVTRQPRRVLETIPSLDVVEIPEAGVCCGSAGIYNLLEPEPARELGARKAAHLITTGARAVVSGNPGCLLQIASALRATGRELPALHLVELLDASIRNSSASIRARS